MAQETVVGRVVRDGAVLAIHFVDPRRADPDDPDFWGPGRGAAVKPPCCKDKTVLPLPMREALMRRTGVPTVPQGSSSSSRQLHRTPNSRNS